LPSPKVANSWQLLHCSFAPSKQVRLTCFTGLALPNGFEGMVTHCRESAYAAALLDNPRHRHDLLQKVDGLSL